MLRVTTSRGHLTGSTENVSSGGLFVRTERPIEPGTEVRLELSFPGLLEPVEVDGTVRWTRADMPDAPAGVGIELSPEARARVEAIARGAPARSGAARPFRILLVEDNPHVVGMYRFALGKLGRSVAIELSEASDGHEALRAIARSRPDLVIADLRMPVLDGVEMLRRLRAAPEMARLPVLVISGGDRESRLAAEEAGADAVLRKPVRSQDVLETVRMLLEARLSI